MDNPLLNLVLDNFGRLRDRGFDPKGDSSPADLATNEAGLKFWRQLMSGQIPPFEICDFVTDQWDQTKNPNIPMSPKPSRPKMKSRSIYHWIVLAASLQVILFAEPGGSFSSPPVDKGVISLINYVHSIHLLWEKAMPKVESKNPEFVVDTAHGKVGFLRPKNDTDPDDWTYLCIGAVDGMVSVKFKDGKVVSATFRPGCSAWQAPGVIITLFPKP